MWARTNKIGGIYLQTFINTYTKVAFAKVFDRNIAPVAADMLNDRVVPLFEAKHIDLFRILTDRGTEPTLPSRRGYRSQQNAGASASIQRNLRTLS